MGIFSKRRGHQPSEEAAGEHGPAAQAHTFLPEGRALLDAIESAWHQREAADRDAGDTRGYRREPQSPEAQRMRDMMDMHEFGVRLYEQQMRNENPEASPEEIEAMVRAWLAAPRLGDPPGRRLG